MGLLPACCLTRLVETLGKKILPLYNGIIQFSP